MQRSSLRAVCTATGCALFLLSGPSPAAAQETPTPTPTDIQPGSITFEDVPYPHPVQYLSFSMYDQDVRMAYMDVAPEGDANGHTVILFHGMNFAGFYFEEPIDVLRKEGFRVVVFDQIGFGRSSKPIISYNFHDMALNTKRVLDELKIDKVMVIGHSMGGMLAARFSTQYPDLVERVVLYNPIGLTDSRYSRPWTSTDDSYERILGLTYQQSLASIRRYFAHDPAAWKPEYATFARIHYSRTLSGDWPRYARVQASIRQITYLDPVVYDWAHIQAPTLAFGGREDGRDFAERMAFIAKSVPNGKGRVHLLPGLGHVPHLEDPARFYPPLLAFLNEEVD